MTEHPALLHGANECAAAAKSLLSSPWMLYEKLVGPARDPTRITSLPSDAAPVFFKRAVELQAGMFKPEIAGALTNMIGHGKFTMDKFHSADRPKRRFF